MKGIKNIIFSSDKEKLTDSAFKQSITISVVGIILCMIALCSATCAWFSTGISSPANNIRSAHCDISILIADENFDGENPYSFESDKDYNVTIKAEGTADSAYCILVVDGEQYYTEQISTVTDHNTMTFTLRFSADKEVAFITRWGTSSKPEAQRLFINGGCYLDLKKMESLPTSSLETESATETTPVASIPVVTE